MEMDLYAVIGWVGAGLLLTGYLLFSVGKFDGKLWLYHCFNLFSSALLLVNAIYNASGPFILVNGVWCCISVYGIIKSLKAKGD
ncbi:MAG: hypothetical protein F9K23_08100 [Bacteroidetes bacterium]|nr:MAG: hypothetical protein F9K23_08100 [Bacteroidota bacterium]